MNKGFMKKGIALMAMFAICTVLNARPHHHFRPVPRHQVTTIVVKKEVQPGRHRVALANKPTKKVIVVKSRKHVNRK